MIAGVCSAFALQYGWDIAVVRLVTVVIALFTSGIGFLAYLAAWIIIPEAQYALPPQVRPGVPPPPGYGGPVAPGEPGAASNSAGNTAV
jgi:phage shock protein C